MQYLRVLPALAVTMVLLACGDSTPERTVSTVDQTTRNSGASACNLVMGWDPWEPYQYQITDQGVLGLDVEILTAILENAGCNISFRRGSWTVLLGLLKSGEVDILAGATQTPDRDQFAWFTDVYRDEEFCLYVPPDQFEGQSEPDIEQLLETGFRIGVIEGYLYGESVAGLQNDPRFQDQFVYSSMGETSVALLLDRKVDGIIEDKFVGAAIIRRKNLFDQVVEHSTKLHKSGVQIMISRASVDEPLFQKINNSLHQLLTNGRIEEVLSHYLN